MDIQGILCSFTSTSSIYKKESETALHGIDSMVSAATLWKNW